MNMEKPPNKPDAANPVMASRFQSGAHWRGVTDPERWLQPFMKGSRFKLGWLLVIGAAALGLLFVIFIWQRDSGSGVNIPEAIAAGLTTAEELLKGQRSKPTPKARAILEADLSDAVQELLVRAKANQFSSYQQFPMDIWPPSVRAVNPTAVCYFDSASHPDGEGVIFVLERNRGWDAGVLFCQQRNTEWQGMHLNGQVMRGGPDFGFRRLHNDGIFWHWYRGSWIAANPTVQRTGVSRFGDETNRTQ